MIPLLLISVMTRRRIGNPLQFLLNTYPQSSLIIKTKKIKRKERDANAG
jgi:hypothetical protein